MKRHISRTTAAGGAVLALALGAVTIAGTTETAHAADPVADCAQPYDVSQLQKGAAVTGLTVTSGTTPQTFTGKVIGTLHDGIAPGVDMIMVDFGESSLVSDVGGIWQGMSGSPVYLDGKLVGAVAYGLSYGPSPIAGVTPFSAMNKYLNATNAPAAARKVAVDDASARTIAARSDATRAQAAEGFTQLPMPLGVSGLSSRRLSGLTDIDRPWAPKSAYAVGRAAGVDADASDVVAGGNIAASMSYGDITAAGVGTVTSVCNGKVVAFGHPMQFLGETTYGLHPADALYIQPDSLGAPFKVANIGAPVGTIDQDRMTGISGTFAALPPSTSVTSTVTYGADSRTGSSDVYVPEATASTVYSEITANHDRVLDGIMPGTERQNWTITGTDENDQPFTITFSDLYLSSYDISGEAGFNLADLMYQLTGLEDVTITSVTADSTVTADHTPLRLSDIQQYRKGAWRSVTGSGANVVPGKALKLRLVLKQADEVSYRTISVPVPAGARGGFLQLTGGNYDYIDTSKIDSVSDAQSFLDAQATNDEIKLVARWQGRKVAKKKVTTLLGPFATVVNGEKSVSINGGAGRGSADCPVFEGLAKRGC